MTEFLIKHFTVKSENVRSTEVRESYGKLAGVVGIITNSILCAIKIIAGWISGSVAITADGINNLADASSSVITLVGFKVASMKSDEDHPYGHARLEYITGMIVSALIIVIGVRLLLSSYEKIQNPEPVDFSLLIIVILVISIAVKIWQAVFNITLGKKINSATLKATGTDSRNDVIATAVVLISLLIGHYSGYNVDGYMGLLVALFIIYSGIMLIKETSSPLLGQAPDPHLVKEIEDLVTNNQGVMGIHDLVVHDYGPGRIFASIHIEVDAMVDVLVSHDLIDNIENMVMEKLHIELVGHMDPIDTSNPMLKILMDRLRELTEPLESVLDVHDLRIVKGDTHTNVIFDLVLSMNSKLTKKEIHDMLETELKKIDPKYEIVITFDTDYTSTMER